MKQLTIGLLSLTIFASCQKEETSPNNGGNSSPSTNINYIAKAPDCIVFRSEFENGETYASVEFDLQKRIKKFTHYVSGQGYIEANYEYVENKINWVTQIVAQGQKEFLSSGTTYLNNSGLADSLIDMYGKRTLFYYFTNGFLKRKVEFNANGTYSGGYAYQYQNNNLTSVYQLNIKPFETEPFDSTLYQTYTYGGQMPNHIQLFNAWLSRQGKPSKNDYSTIYDRNGELVEKASYTYVGNKIKYNFMDEFGNNYFNYLYLKCW